jgi:hypothetical protein
MSESGYNLKHATIYDELLNLRVHRAFYCHKMEMQRIIEMLARMDANMKTLQERAEVERKPHREEEKSNKEQILAKMEANKHVDWEERKAEKENLKRMEKIMSRVIQETQSLQKACQETTASHEATEADAEKIEPNPGMMHSISEHEEVPKEDAIVKPVKGRKKRHRGQKLAAGQRGEPKEKFMDPGKCWLPPAGRCPAVQQLHGKRETSSGKF